MVQDADAKWSKRQQENLMHTTKIQKMSLRQRNVSNNTNKHYTNSSNKTLIIAIKKVILYQ